MLDQHRVNGGDEKRGASAHSCEKCEVADESSAQSAADTIGR
jgi:hypothetical protein